MFLQRRKMRMEPSQLSNSGLLPKVAQAQTSSRSSTFQPAFQTTTFAAGTLPKIGGATSTTTTTTFLPSLGQAFMKPVKPKQVTTTQVSNRFYSCSTGLLGLNASSARIIMMKMIIMMKRQFHWWRKPE